MEIRAVEVTKKNFLVYYTYLSGKYGQKFQNNVIRCQFVFTSSCVLEFATNKTDSNMRVF